MNHPPHPGGHTPPAAPMAGHHHNPNLLVDALSALVRVVVDVLVGAALTHASTRRPAHDRA